ncbi:MAG: carbon monoxide dehydrogenase accessory protein [Nocardioidaceae bacterium]|nr:carbon monoxide dehydrogenase accessory protein [Nocardioidaceae bacterium]
MTTPLSDRIDELRRLRVPFVQATVVRAQDPSSARAGDRAIVLADGSIEGFVGGQCAAGSVRTAALGALESGEGVLLRVLPDGDDTFPHLPGASIVVNPCLSGGALEIYLEPLLPSPVLYLVGSSPTAEAVAALAPTLGFVVDRASEGARPEGAVAAVVSSHGGDEAGAVRAALDAGVGFVGLVCSHTRGQALLEELDLPESELRRVHPHVGLEIGARTAPEIALSILAALVRSIRLEGLTAPSAPGTPPPPVQVVDPVCGMTVTVGAETPHARIDGVDHWFCGPGCRDSYVAAHVS